MWSLLWWMSIENEKAKYTATPTPTYHHFSRKYFLFHTKRQGKMKKILWISSCEMSDFCQKVVIDIRSFFWWWKVCEHDSFCSTGNFHQVVNRHSNQCHQPTSSIPNQIQIKKTVFCFAHKKWKHIFINFVLK